MQGLDIKKLDILENAIRDAGAYAKQMQSKVHRSYKADGSVLTEVDLEISHRILSLLQNLFPDCGIISEEETTERKEDAEYTFVLDPIDGTDVYSQGLPTFAIGLGILDKERRPVGAMISAPRFGIGKDEPSYIIIGKNICDPDSKPLWSVEGRQVYKTGERRPSYELRDSITVQGTL